MKKYRFGLLLTAAAMAVFSACDSTSAEWDDTLPTPATTSVPTVYYEIESTTTTEEITLPTRESTSRTAYSEPAPELATTTATTTEETEETTVPASSVINDVPKVPISQYTSTRASSITTIPTQTSSDSLSSSSSDAATTTTVPTLQQQQATISAAESTLSATVTEAEITDINVPYKLKDSILRPYSYNQLDAKSTYVYDALITAIEQNKTDINFPEDMNITVDDYQAVYQQVYSDENSIYYIDTTMKYARNSKTQTIASAIISYKYSSNEIKRMQEAVEEETDKLIGKITINMTEYDIVKFFYDYLAENVKYDESKNSDHCRDIYGVFINKKALCDGYSKAFSYLCDKVGIETLTITGEADGIPHMWNMVKIGGEWYHIDITYAVTDSNLGKYVRYDYFCVNDDVVEARDIYEQNYQYPKATSERCNYYVKNGLMADSWNEAETMLKNRILDAAKNKELVAQIRCSSRELYFEAIYNLFDRTQAKAITLMEDANEKSDNKFKCDNISYSHDSNTYVIKLFLEYKD